MILETKIQWIVNDVGGRSTPAFKGMRPGFRFQKYISESLSAGLDAEVIELIFNETNQVCDACLKVDLFDIYKNLKITNDESFELTDGFRVIAVGKITRIIEQA